MSAGGMPELGSKISLISKADIRYEGRLFTVDPQECTIALANGKLMMFACENVCVPAKNGVLNPVRAQEKKNVDHHDGPFSFLQAR